MAPPGRVKMLKFLQWILKDDDVYFKKKSQHLIKWPLDHNGLMNVTDTWSTEQAIV